MLKMPLVSIVIAAYNMAKYLPLAIQSALDQIYDNVEVLIIDDGSADDTISVVQPFLVDPRVRYIYQQNAGQASAKNHGICKSRGEFIAFLDADDIWLPGKLEQQVPLFLKSPSIGVVYSRYIEIDAEGKELRLLGSTFYRGNVSGHLLVFNFVGFSTSVVRRECFDQFGCFKEDLGMGIDYELWLRFSTQYEFDYVDRPLVFYRVWSGQMSKNCKQRYLNGIKTMRKFLQEHSGLVSEDLRREAWAHTYSGFAQCLHSSELGMGLVLKYYLRALSYKPTYVFAWKGIVKTILSMK